MSGENWNDDVARGDNLEERLIDFAVRILRMCEAMPDSPGGRHIRSQLLRCRTSPAPNYGEARSAESPRDFVHKLKVVQKELNETRVWLKMIARAEILPSHKIRTLLDGCDQLCRIIGASIQTSRKHTK